MLIDKTDKSEFTSRNFKCKFLRWKCSYHSTGCDAFFKTNITMTEFRGHPHLFHSNHEGGNRLLALDPILLYRRPQMFPAEEVKDDKQAL